jgi:hypothetical protein
MNTTEHTCPICQGTGMTRSGSLDCSYQGCNAATERARFNERLEREQGVKGPWMLLEVAWAAYRMGQESMGARNAG